MIYLHKMISSELLVLLAARPAWRHALDARVSHMRLEVFILRVARCSRPSSVPLEAALACVSRLMRRTAPSPEGSAHLGARDVGGAQEATVDALGAHAASRAAHLAAADVVGMGELIGEGLARDPRLRWERNLRLEVGEGRQGCGGRGPRARAVSEAIAPRRAG